MVVTVCLACCDLPRAAELTCPHIVHLRNLTAATAATVRQQTDCAAATAHNRQPRLHRSGTQLLAPFQRATDQGQGLREVRDGARRGAEGVGRNKGKLRRH